MKDSSVSIDVGTRNAQVRGGMGDRILLQLGKFVFACKHEDGKPATCDLVP